MQTWVASLPEHLRFSQANLDKQIDMFETGATSAAWCYCFMHTLHPCFILELMEVRSRSLVDGRRNAYRLSVVSRPRVHCKQSPLAGFATSWTGYSRLPAIALRIPYCVRHRITSRVIVLLTRELH